MSAVRVFAVMILAGAFHLTNAQGVNSIQIIPLEPTSNDTILVISDFSYYGACEYGLVYDYSHTDDTSIYIAPTYCGYFLQDSVLCQSVDTFKVGPLPAGTYAMNIDYHQGSICPISDFDATIGEFDTSIIVVTGTSAAPQHQSGTNTPLRVYPNPASVEFFIHLHHYSQHDPLLLSIRNVLGQEVFRKKIDTVPMQVDASTMNGVYFLNVIDHTGKAIGVSKVVIH